MRSLLRGSLGRSLKTLEPEDRLVAAWTVACGRVLASQGTVLTFENGNLRVEVAHAVWMQQFLGMRSQLAAEISRIAGLPVREINFELRGARPPMDRPTIRPALPNRSGRGKTGKTR